ncbi:MULTISPECIES: AraC family transcriptional regulator [Clostridium]|jgi:AraC-like DNA-binding protein|uniref:Transcriptional regulator, AraC family n=1 Tax=Clostridium saccharoperbutylacetonicum N1-4(HMT) TaxID=931276 RepID=M1MR51_9CLOT|nr:MULTISPECIES: AraC family transcriptional regulator [Clostridium]AGF58643.1 transcriptional regulator, AraC family [Clostridium saccharoperbutylacetonicum N1-4(HMT)]AQR97334.1 HTH-type transcriptional activator Btr [Clostridium saccharoperbutylacetonicum]NRT60578.1 AraC-like DNA-binding protein [Clostridium saccharoperbutylacetonicum]NSB23892.1 AraC-like DNA-binding protein [Clostridium saccharoperbutylacetonicum]NSB33217.1 AraC-like DNA-binding protein [Clostridium saccharoperbutylacetonic
MKKKIHDFFTRKHMISSDYEIFHFLNTDLPFQYLHNHDFYELYLYLSGDVTYLIEGKSYNLKSGDIILINTNELHRAVINSMKAPYERIVLWINKSFLHELSTTETDLTQCFENIEKKNVLRPDFQIQQNIRAQLSKLLDLENYKGIGKDLLYKAYMLELIIQLNNLVLNDKSDLDIEITKSNLIDGIVEYINNHINEEITIDELSKEFYLSKFHLAREFKKYTGTSIHRYCMQKKLIAAKELILNHHPINVVYKQSGFGDYTNFFRAFKNEYGISPKQFYKLMVKSDSEI